MHKLSELPIIASINSWTTRNWKWLSWLPGLLCVCSGLVCALTGNFDLWMGIGALGILFGTAVSAIMLLVVLVKFRPRRGVHYAYWNRYLLVFGMLVLGLAGMPFLIGYITIRFKLPDEFFTRPFAAWLIGFPLAWVLWFKFSFLPTWGFWRLDRRYPEMTASARRLRQGSPAYAWFMPLLIVQGQPYLLVGYGGYILPFVRITTLDTEGQFVAGETLAETLMRCYKLALDVLYVNNSLQHAFEIEKLRKTHRLLQREFPRFHQNEAYFREAGGEVYDHWKNIADFEQNLDTILTTLVARKIWQAQWAYNHGLNRLTEISDEQLREVETQLAKFDKVLADCTRQVEAIAASADALLGSIEILADPLTSMDGRRFHLQRRRLLKRLLKHLAEFCWSAVAWQKPVDDFRPREHDWDAWRRCRALMMKIDIQETVSFLDGF